MGMGVDRVVCNSESLPMVVSDAVHQLQFKVVTPDGQYRIANECQNEDLFFALRGGK